MQYTNGDIHMAIALMREERKRNEAKANEQAAKQKELQAGHEGAPQEPSREAHARRYTSVDAA